MKDQFRKVLLTIETEAIEPCAHKANLSVDTVTQWVRRMGSDCLGNENYNRAVYECFWEGKEYKPQDIVEWIIIFKDSKRRQNELEEALRAINRTEHEKKVLLSTGLSVDEAAKHDAVANLYSKEWKRVVQYQEILQKEIETRKADKKTT